MVERKPTSLKVDPELWEEVKIMSIRVHKNITKYFEDALRERLVKDYEIVAAERKRKEQERLDKEQLDQRYQQIINTDPGVDAYNKDNVRLDTNVTNILQQSQSETFSDDNMSTLLRKGTIYEIPLPGLKFPVTKEGLQQYGKGIINDRGREEVLFVFRNLDTPDNKVYNNISMLEEDISKFFNRIPDVIKYKRKHDINEMIRLKINTKEMKTLDSKGKEITAAAKTAGEELT
jgi:hypothetical protein